MVGWFHGWMISNIHFLGLQGSNIYSTGINYKSTVSCSELSLLPQCVNSWVAIQLKNRGRFLFPCQRPIFILRQVLKVKVKAWSTANAQHVAMSKYKLITDTHENAWAFLHLQRWTFFKSFRRVREIHLSLARHFVWQTFSPSPDILNSRRAFHCKMSSKYQMFPGQTLSLIFSWRTKYPARSNPFAGYFQNSPDMSGQCGEFRILWPFVQMTWFCDVTLFHIC